MSKSDFCFLKVYIGEAKNNIDFFIYLFILKTHRSKGSQTAGQIPVDVPPEDQLHVR